VVVLEGQLVCDLVIQIHQIQLRHNPAAREQR
jgi:hypothetical protein